MSKGLLVVCLGACSPGCLTAGGKAPSEGDAQNGGSAPWGLKTRRRHTNSFRVQPGCLFVRPARSPHLSESTLPPGPCSQSTCWVALPRTRQPHGLPSQGSHPRGHAGRDSSRQEGLKTQGSRVKETHTDPNMERRREFERCTDTVLRPREGHPEVRVREGAPGPSAGAPGQGGQGD